MRRIIKLLKNYLLIPDLLIFLLGAIFPAMLVFFFHGAEFNQIYDNLFISKNEVIKSYLETLVIWVGLTGQRGLFSGE